MEEVKKNDVKPKKKLSKKIIFIIVAAVMAAVFVIIFTCCWFLVPESYHFDLESLITEANLSWSDEFDGDTNGESIGCSGSNGTPLEDGKTLSCSYQWRIPVNLEDVSFIQIGETQISIPNN